MSLLLQFIINILKCGPMPEHLAIIMDGNRRYAKQHSLAVSMGHEKGLENATALLSVLINCDIKHITFYTFSIENFNRSGAEKSFLLDDLLPQFISDILTRRYDYLDRGVRFRFVGKLTLCPKKLQNDMETLERVSYENQRCIVNLAVAYTSRDEIMNAVKRSVDKIQKGEVNSEEVDGKYVENQLYIPQKVDCLVRTSGENRFSDFLLWQNENAHVLIYDTLWPAFKLFSFIKMIVHYQRLVLKHRIC